MTEIIVEPRWPCAISDKLKQQMLSIAQQGCGFRKTQKHAGIYYITRGLGILYFTSEYMNNKLGAVIGADDWIGAISLGSGINMSNLFMLSEELEPIEYLFFPRHKMAQLAEENQEAFKFLYYCLVKIQPEFLQMQLTALHDKEARVVYTLIALAQKTHVINGAKIAFKITQEQLSSATGLSRPRINEVLKKIEKNQEISICRGKIYILDMQALGNRLIDCNTMFHDPRAAFNYSQSPLPLGGH